MKRRLASAILSLTVMTACGGAVGDDAESERIATSLQFNVAAQVEQDSYFPLTPGLTTVFPSDSSHSGESDLGVGLVVTDTTNLVVEVLEDGVVRISGRQDTDPETPETYVDIVETLQFREEGTELSLVKVGIQRTDSSGKLFTNERVYDPPIHFVFDTTLLNTRFEEFEEKPDTGIPTFTSFHRTVVYSGDPEIYEVTSGDTTATVTVAELSDVETHVLMNNRKSIRVNGNDIDAYRLAAQIDSGTAANIWYPLSGLSRGQFWVAKGIGIVGLGAYVADHQRRRVSIEAL